MSLRVNNLVGFGAQEQPTRTYPVAAHFDGTNDYLLRGAALTGLSDGKALTISMWVNLDASSSDTTNYALLSVRTGGTLGINLRRTTGGDVRCTCDNPSGTPILVTDAFPLVAADDWMHFFMTFDLAVSANAYIYINGVSSATPFDTFTDDTIDFTHADFGVASRGDVAGAEKLFGELADVWMNDQYLDPAIYLRKFITNRGNPASGLGSDGSGATGAAPLIFMSGDIDGWETNKGTGGGFTETGTITAGTGP